MFAVGLYIGCIHNVTQHLYSARMLEGRDNVTPAVCLRACWDYGKKSTIQVHYLEWALVLISL